MQKFSSHRNAFLARLTFKLESSTWRRLGNSDRRDSWWCDDAVSESHRERWRNSRRCRWCDSVGRSVMYFVFLPMTIVLMAVNSGNRITRIEEYEDGKENVSCHVLLNLISDTFYLISTKLSTHKWYELDGRLRLTSSNSFCDNFGFFGATVVVVVVFGAGGDSSSLLVTVSTPLWKKLHAFIIIF